jgi:hypothetical protein
MPPPTSVSFGDHECRGRAGEYGAAQLITEPIDFNLLKVQPRRLPSDPRRGRC